MDQLSHLPKVDRLAQLPELSHLPDFTRIEAAKRAISEARRVAMLGEIVDEDRIIELALVEADRLSRPSMRRVINATGIILHTGLGRARLAQEAADAVAEVASGHSAVEFDLETGERGDRQSHVRDMLCELTGAADALVVNNCAAAVFLALHALCHDRSVLLSRGQLVEIGGQFRMPDIIQRTGCRLTEVGTTNKTHLRDYSEADTGDVAAILRCHRSNFEMSGFVSEPSTAELADLAHSKGWLFIDDVGSGALVDFRDFGLEPEPMMKASIADGADLVLASGDKLMGGPQAGILVGSVETIRRVMSHPIARALRVDKLTLAALSATLKLYVQGRQDRIPTIQALSRSIEAIEADARRLADAYPNESIVEPGRSELGGGSAPGQSIPTVRIGLKSPSAQGLSSNLRSGQPSIVGRIERGIVWLDPRTIDPYEIELVADRLKQL